MRTGSMRDADGRITFACTAARFPHRRRRHRRPARRDRAGAGGPRRSCSPRPSRREQHRLRAGRHRRRGRRRRHARRCTRPTRSRAGDGLCDEAAVARARRGGPALRARADRVGRAVRSRRRRPARRSAARRRTASAACCTPATRPAARSAACCGSASRAAVGRDDQSRAGHRAARRRRRACAASRYFDRGGARARASRARATLLATGGAGQVFRETTNPAVATGDGIALAYHAGARVADLEFVQFHPTALNVAGAPRFLISEALRGEGARLVNASGEAFMTRYHPDGDLAPRDVVARGIVREIGARPAARVPDARAPRRRLRARAVSDDRGDVRAASGSISRAIRFRSVRRRTTSWAASTPTMGADVAAGPVRRRRGRLHRRPRRQSAGQQLAARGARVRRPRRRRRCSSRQCARAAEAGSCRLAWSATRPADRRRSPARRVRSREPRTAGSPAR